MSQGNMAERLTDEQASELVAAHRKRQLTRAEVKTLRDEILARGRERDIAVRDEVQTAQNCQREVDELRRELDEARSMRGLCADTKCGHCEGCKNRAAREALQALGVEFLIELESGPTAAMIFCKDLSSFTKLKVVAQELAALRKDKARLDLIEKHADSSIQIAGPPGYWWEWEGDQPLRDFLDSVAEQRAAMEAEDE